MRDVSARDVEREVARGRFGKAANMLDGYSQVAAPSQETSDAFRDKSPKGLPNRIPGQSQQNVMNGLSSLNPDTACGIFGWTVDLLSVAAKSPRVQAFLHALTLKISDGSAPGRDMLTVGELTALRKLSDDGSPSTAIRPIAVGN